MTNATKSVILAVFVAVALLATATPPFAARNAAATATTWAKTYGGLENMTVAGRAVQPTADGGYAVLGEARAADGNTDIWVLKLDASGAVEWQYLFGGAGMDRPYTMLQTTDGGYIVAAATHSFGPGVSSAGTSLNAWILKLDALGGVQWQKVYGGDGSDNLLDIRQTSDGGYVAAGYSTSHRLGLPYDDALEAWVIKLDSTGNAVWQQAYGGGNPDECATSIQQTSDGGYIVAGSVIMWPPGQPGKPSAWLFKLTSVGKLVWQKAYGAGSGGYTCGINAEYPQVLKTPDGGYLLTQVYLYGPEQDDGWVLKVDSVGKVQWRKAYGRTDGVVWRTEGMEHFLSVDSTTDGYVVAGHFYDGVGYVPWAVRLNSDGTVQWQKTYVGGAVGSSIVHQTSDGGFILVGARSGNVTVFKLGGDGNAGGCVDPGIGADSSATVRSASGKASGYNAKTASPATSVTSTSATPSATSASVGTLCTG